MSYHLRREAPRNAFLFLTLVLIAGLCVGRAPAGETTESADETSVLVERGSAARLTLQGRLVASYGAFDLFEVPTTELRRLGPQPGLKIRPNAGRLALRSGAFDTNRPSEAAHLPVAWRENLEPSSARLYLIQFVGPPKNAWLESVRQTGAETVHPFQVDAELVWASAPALEKLKALAQERKILRYAGPYQPYYKLPEGLRAAAADLEPGSKPLTVTVQRYAKTDRKPLQDLLNRLDAKPVSAWSPVLSYENVRLRILPGRLGALAQQPDVVWIEPWSAPKMDDEVQAQILATLEDGAAGPDGPGYLAWLAERGLSTDPQDYPVLAINDDGLGNGTVEAGDPTLHIEGNPLKPTRVVFNQDCTTEDGGSANGHGHINTSIAGGYDTRTGNPFQDELGFFRGLGVNPFARLAGVRIFDRDSDFVIDGCGGDIAGIIAANYVNGARISSNSWGTTFDNGDYNDLAQVYDAATRDALPDTPGLQPLLFLFSAGNSGVFGPSTVGAPGSGKNVTAVGASENTRPDGVDGCGSGPLDADNAQDVAYFSSRGPVEGGRTKPDIIAPGTHVQGTASPSEIYDGAGVCDQFWPPNQTVFARSSGTSHSTPGAAGVASLDYAWLQLALGVVEPSPALVKAYMVAHTRYLSGLDAGDTLPSNNQGYGMPDLEMSFEQIPRFLVNQTEILDTTGDERNYSVPIADPNRPVRIVLTWTDQPGPLFADPQINNLDLEAELDGTTYLGNVFAGGHSVPDGTADAANTVEAIYLPAGSTGTLSLRVLGTSITGDGVPETGDALDQDFALVCYNCAAEPTGRLGGTVTDSVDPIPGARIEAHDAGDNRTYTTFTTASGAYKLVLPAGSYAVTASKHGYAPQTEPTVLVGAGDPLAVQSFELDQQGLFAVSGTITDGSIGGWPLYARILITAPGFASFVYTDPATGHYSVSLPAETDYEFAVSAVSAGYQTAQRSIPLASADRTEDFALGLALCTAPGYEFDDVYHQDFEADDGGFTVEGINPSMEWGVPAHGPKKAASGVKAWGTGLSLGFHNFGENSHAVSPTLDLSAPEIQNKGLLLSWAHAVSTEKDFDFASVEVSKDGGTNWNTVYGPASGHQALNWRRQTVLLDPSYAVADFRVRFSLAADDNTSFFGLYFDDLRIAAVAPPAPLLSEGFESFPPADWSTARTGASGVALWGGNTSEAHSGSASAAHTGMMSSSLAIDWLVSSQVTLTPTSELKLWQKEIARAHFEEHKVWILTGSPDPNTAELHEVAELSALPDAEWHEATLPVGEFAGEPLWIAFSYRSTTDTTGSWFLDDIEVTGGSVPLDLPCKSQPGGLVVGRVTDANFPARAVNGVVVSSDSGASTSSSATQLDELLEDGFYSMFLPAGTHTLTAQPSQGYAAQSLSVQVTAGQTTSQDFSLNAGLFTALPLFLEATLELGGSVVKNLTLKNEGTAEAIYALVEAHGERTVSRPGPVQQDFPVERRQGKFSSHAIVASEARSDSMASVLLSSRGTAETAWQDARSLPMSIMDSAAVESDGKVYSFGGTTIEPTFQYLDKAFVFDVAADTWSPIAPMPGSRQQPVAAAIGGLIYVVSGWDVSTILDTTLIYDPSQDLWTEGAPMPAAASAAGSAVLNDQLYVIGGCENSGGCGGQVGAFRYDPGTDQWTTLAPYPESISWQSCGAIGAKIYCAGGIHGDGQTRNRTYAYDPVANQWERRADMPADRWGAYSTASGGKLYITAGVTAGFSTITNETFVYDPFADAWSMGPSSQHALYRGADACGFYKIGGSTIGAGFQPVRNVELNADLSCVGVDWISETPVTDLVQDGDQRPIQVLFDANTPTADQPGVYTTQLKIDSITPYSVADVPVTMTVTAPASWGKIAGTVHSLGYCDAEHEPLPSASVAIQGGVTLQAGASGQFSRWLEQGAYQLVVSAPGHLTKTSSVTVAPQATTNLSFELRLDQPCGSDPPPAPASFQVSLVEGETALRALDLTNSGARALVYTLHESALDLEPSRASAPPPGLPLGTRPSRVGKRSQFARAWLGKQRPRAATADASRPQTEDVAWFPAATLPEPVERSYFGAAQCPDDSDRYYLVAGLDPFSPDDAFSRYDVGSNSWAVLTPIPGAGLDSPAATCMEQKIYVLGGSDSFSATSEMWIYDIRGGQWSGPVTMPRAAAGAAAASWNGKVYLIGGVDETSTLSDRVDVYDVETSQWSPGASLPVATSWPGFVQAGPQVYLVGGFSELFNLNANATQRYDLVQDAWQAGPVFTAARANFAMAITDQFLYAIGGDDDGDSAFNHSNHVDRLDWTQWPAGAWEQAESLLPFPRSAQRTGFCTSVIASSEIWTVSGFDLSFPNIYYRPSATEKCHSIYSDVPWLSQTPASGSVAPDSAATLELRFDSTGLEAGAHRLFLDTVTNDPSQSTFRVPITLTVQTSTPGLALTPASSGRNAAPGGSAVHTLTVTNQGNRSDTFDVQITGNAWVTTAPLVVGPLAAGASQSLFVTVQVPADALPGQSDAPTLKLSSRNSIALTRQSTLTTTANKVRGLTLTPASAQANGKSGQSVVYRVTVKNTGNAEDSFSAAVAGNVWSTVPGAGSIGPLAAGAQTELTVTVTIPAAAVAGATDAATLTVSSAGNGAVRAQAHLTTLVDTVHDLAVNPKLAQSPARPGTQASYLLTLDNLGNASDTYSLSVSGNSWVTVPSALEVGPVAAGAQATFTVTVNVPSGAQSGQKDVAVVLISSKLDSARSASATLTTEARIPILGAPGIWAGVCLLCALAGLGTVLLRRRGRPSSG